MVNKHMQTQLNTGDEYYMIPPTVTNPTRLSRDYTIFLLLSSRLLNASLNSLSQYEHFSLEK